MKPFSKSRAYSFCVIAITSCARASDTQMGLVLDSSVDSSSADASVLTSDRSVVAGDASSDVLRLEDQSSPRVADAPSDATAVVPIDVQAPPDRTATADTGFPHTFNPNAVARPSAEGWRDHVSSECRGGAVAIYRGAGRDVGTYVGAYFYREVPQATCVVQAEGACFVARCTEEGRSNFFYHGAVQINSSARDYLISRDRDGYYNGTTNSAVLPAAGVAVNAIFSTSGLSDSTLTVNTPASVAVVIPGSASIPRDAFDVAWTRSTPATRETDLVEVEITQPVVTQNVANRLYCVATANSGSLHVPASLLGDFTREYPVSVQVQGRASAFGRLGDGCHVQQSVARIDLPSDSFYEVTLVD